MASRTEPVGLRRRASCVAGLLVVASGLLFASPARADEPAGGVEDLKKRGNQAMMELNYAQALEAYRAALALAPDDAVLHYNLGRALQAREEYPAALDALETFAKKASPELRARVPKLDELIQDVRGRIATIELTCSADAPSATVRVGSRTTLTGCSPSKQIVRVAVPERRASLEVGFSDPRLQAQTARAEVVGGGPSVAVTLAVLPKASSGRLVVKATPVSAKVAVDGVFRGTPPVEIPLGPGAHTVDIEADRHDAARVPVLIDVGATRELDIRLQQSAPLTSKWWFWTGLSVLAVGTGVLVWYLVEQPEGSATPGSIDPGLVPAGVRF
ncbi:MAG: PEGA domain-containing protein [Deltaproteobacteria bacterium]|nr:PEGA domain-containing protein [Deltaproteobacteria bacterium]